MRLSLEVKSLVGYMATAGIPHRVTSTTAGSHAATSRHFAEGTDGQGLAVDFAAPTPGDVAGMLRIYRAFLGAYNQLHELIFWDGGVGVTELVRRRTRVVPLAYAKALPAHRNHVHVSVDKGTFLEWKGRILVADDPQIPNLVDVKFFVPIVTADGLCTGYYMASSAGEVHGHGLGAPFHGRSEVVTPPK